jgi:hypothetical protein
MLLARRSLAARRDCLVEDEFESEDDPPATLRVAMRAWDDF